MNKNKKAAKAEDEQLDEQTKTANDATEPSELDTVKEQNAELNDRLIRQMAEFDNYKKRTSKEKDELAAYAKGICVKELLSVIDNFERALEVPCQDEGYKKGMEMIFNQFTQTLTKLDVSEIEAFNQPFDPDFHNAINQIEDASFGENTVCQVLQKGYKLGEKVIRHSMVVVANP